MAADVNDQEILRRGFELVDEGDLEGAQRILEQISDRTSRGSGWLELGNACLGAHRPSEAVEHLARAVACLPENGTAWLGLGLASAASKGERTFEYLLVAHFLFREQGQEVPARAVEQKLGDLNPSERLFRPLVCSLASAGLHLALGALLASEVDVNEPEPESGNNALGFAVTVGDAEAVRLLLRAGAEVDSPGNLGMTALMLASAGGQEKLVEALLQAGASVESRDVKGSSALHLAAGRLHAPIVHRLLRAGANPSAEGPLGLTPLHVAIGARAGGESVQLGATVLALLEAGADTEATHPSFGTPLSLAVSRGFVEAVRLLAKHGSEPEAQSAPSE